MNKIYEKFPPKEAGHIFLGDGTGDLCIHTSTTPPQSRHTPVISRDDKLSVDLENSL
jgi:hypothetical protein